MAEIRFLSRGEPDKLQGGVVIEGFPDSGQAGTIASSRIIASLKLTLVSELYSDYFPPFAAVLEVRAQATARIYADRKSNIAIFLGDFSTATLIPIPILVFPVRRVPVLTPVQAVGMACSLRSSASLLGRYDTTNCC